METRVSPPLSLGRVVRDYIWPVVAFIIIVAILPFCLVVSFCLRIYRHTLRDYVQSRLDEKNAQLVGHEDSVWFPDTPYNRAIINSLIINKGEIHLEKWRKTIHKRLVQPKNSVGRPMFPKLVQYVQMIMTRPVWVPERNFDINEHVVLWKRSVPASQKDMDIVVSYLASQPLPPQRSPWQLVLIPTTQYSEPHFALLMRIHHGIGDGISLSKLIMTHVVDVPPEGHRPPRFATKNRLSRMLKAIYEGPRLLLEQLFTPDDYHALHGQSLSGDKLVASSKQFDLQFIKDLKNAANCTVNDVLTSCLAGALRDYFKRHCSSIPSNMTALVPVDIRRKSDELELDNQFALVFLPLPMDCDDDLSLLHQTKATMERIKKSPEPVMNALLLRLILARLPPTFCKWVLDALSNKCSLVMSNVPGPQQPMHICGCEMKEMIFWPPQRAKCGIGVSILSYNGHVKMGVLVDRVLLSNPSILVQLFEDRVEALGKELNIKS